MLHRLHRQWHLADERGGLVTLRVALLSASKGHSFVLLGGLGGDARDVGIID